MKIIAIKQSKSGSNEFFILDSYEEYNLADILELAEKGLIDNIDLAKSRQGKLHVRAKKNSQSGDNLERCAITCNESDYLMFDGRSLKLKTRNGRLKRSWPATSGAPGSAPSGQSRADYGPIPEGRYSARFDKTLDIESGQDLWDQLKWIIKSPRWGLIVTPLEPLQGTKTYGRGDFSIHGGFFPGSKGCIDLTFKNDDFHALLRLYRKNIDVLVKY